MMELRDRIERQRRGEDVEIGAGDWVAFDTAGTWAWHCQVEPLVLHYDVVIVKLIRPFELDGWLVECAKHENEAHLSGARKLRLA